ncbi:hypothetical protein [Variovorax sp. LG9.2]|uniref:hypothetical protein n=1 Tax=Variovorax sp. LG9.2 TaxID=3048626 RepID=UPI002B23DC09|nr:hypothetical protein [Variovorax sp. LG9.2]MEB0057323.1 hypothetical protein [Variovorax sp. LG9.2]
MSPAQMSFFAAVQQLGAVAYAKPKAAKLADPLAQAKAKFVASATKQIELVKSAADKGLWFVKLADGSYAVTLKNGVAAIQKENGSYKLANAAQAIKFLEMAVEACKKGEFDPLLTATLRARKSTEVVVDHSAANATIAAVLAAPIAPASTKIKK